MLTHVNQEPTRVLEPEVLARPAVVPALRSGQGSEMGALLPRCRVRSWSEITAGRSWRGGTAGGNTVDILFQSWTGGRFEYQHTWLEVVTNEGMGGVALQAAR
jgi:hypothetical protein